MSRCVGVAPTRQVVPGGKNEPLSPCWRSSEGLAGDLVTDGATTEQLLVPPQSCSFEFFLPFCFSLFAFLQSVCLSGCFQSCFTQVFLHLKINCFNSFHLLVHTIQVQSPSLQPLSRAAAHKVHPSCEKQTFKPESLKSRSVTRLHAHAQL